MHRGAMKATSHIINDTESEQKELEKEMAAMCPPGEEISLREQIQGWLMQIIPDLTVADGATMYVPENYWKQ